MAKRFLIVFLILAGLFLYLANYAQAQTVSLSPASLEIGKDTSFSLTLSVSTVSNLFGVAFDLNFNPSLISYVSTTEGNFLSQGCQTSLMTAQNPQGKLIFGLTRLGVACGGVTDQGALATINFKSLTQEGTNNLSFSNNSLCLLSGSSCNYVTGTWNGAAVTVKTSQPPDTTPPAISGVGASSITSSGATITWNTDKSSDSQVEYGLAISYGSQTILNTSLVTSHSQFLSGLTANTLYHYRVKSRDAAGNLATSGVYTFTTGSPSCTPRSLVSSSVSPVSINPGGSYTISCDYGATTNAINPVVGSGSCIFQSFLGTAARFNCTAGSVSGIFSNSCVFSNMPPNYYCARTDAIVNLTVTSPVDTSPPTMPTNLSATAVSSSQINLSWTASTDNVGVSGYYIRRCQGSGCTPSVQIVNSSSNSYSDATLSASNVYVYTVAAYDAAGNSSSYSSSASIVTLAAAVSVSPAPSPAPSGGGGGGGGGGAVAVTTPTVTVTPTLENVQSKVASVAAKITALPKNPTASDLTSIQAEINVILSELKTVQAVQPTPQGVALGFHFVRPLALGMKSDDVKNLQTVLKTNPTIYPEGVVNGRFGPATLRAVQRFQEKYSIAMKGQPGYGVVGPKTRAKLNEVMK